MTKILIIDDEADFRTVLKQVLADQGYEVVMAPDGVRGLQMVMDMQIDLLLLDLRMPHRDGLETLRLIRAVQPETKIIMLTALMNETEQAEARQLGVKDIVFKPVSVKVLIEKVGQVLETGHDRE